MIDEKKIEEAAQETADLYEQDLPTMSYYEDTEVDGQHHFCQNFGAELFKDGAKWAINEFLKDLWHPAEEKPKNDTFIILKPRNEKRNYAVYWIYKNVWKNLCAYFPKSKMEWLYINDLLPKKGGQQ